MPIKCWFNKRILFSDTEWTDSVVNTFGLALYLLLLCSVNSMSFVVSLVSDNTAWYLFLVSWTSRRFICVCNFDFTSLLLFVPLGGVLYLSRDSCVWSVRSKPPRFRSQIFGWFQNVFSDLSKKGVYKSSDLLKCKVTLRSNGFPFSNISSVASFQYSWVSVSSLLRIYFSSFQSNLTPDIYQNSSQIIFLRRLLLVIRYWLQK